MFLFLNTAEKLMKFIVKALSKAIKQGIRLFHCMRMQPMK